MSLASLDSVIYTWLQGKSARFLQRRKPQLGNQTKAGGRRQIKLHNSLSLSCQPCHALWAPWLRYLKFWLSHVWVYMAALINMECILIHGSRTDCLWSLSLTGESDNQCLGKLQGVRDTVRVEICWQTSGGCSHTFSSRLLSGVQGLD